MQITSTIHSEFEYVTTNVIPGDSGGKVNILGGNSIGHCEKNVHMNMCLIPNGYRNRTV